VKAPRGRGAVAVDIDGGVAWITLGRPRVDLPLATALAEACEELALDSAVHVVVLRSSAADFSLGLPARQPWLGRGWPDPVAAVAALPQPVLAAVDGEARGWGFALALACDLRIASARAVFSAPDAPAGRLPGGGLTQRLPRVVGTSRAMAMLLLGKRVRAPEAHACGLASEVVPASRLAAVVSARTRALAEKGPIALCYAKEAVRRALDLPLDDGVRLEHDLYVLLQTTADRREGVDAFRQRRRPGFQAR
jgi:enoyl-CoA hydratase/carnithine racemase